MKTLLIIILLTIAPLSGCSWVASTATKMLQGKDGPSLTVNAANKHHTKVTGASSDQNLNSNHGQVSNGDILNNPVYVQCRPWLLLILCVICLWIDRPDILWRKWRRNRKKRG